MTGSFATLGGAIIFESLRQIQLDKLSRNPYCQSCRDNANMFGTLRTASIVGFGFIYLFNIIDASIIKHTNNITHNFKFYPDYYCNSYMFTLQIGLNNFGNNEKNTKWNFYRF